MAIDTSSNQDFDVVYCSYCTVSRFTSALVVSYVMNQVQTEGSGFDFDSRRILTEGTRLTDTILARALSTHTRLVRGCSSWYKDGTTLVRHEVHVEPPGMNSTF